MDTKTVEAQQRSSNSWLRGLDKSPSWVGHAPRKDVNIMVGVEKRALAREPAWETPPMAKVIRKEVLAYAKAGSSLRKPPVPEQLPPKPESVLCSHLHLWLYGGLSPITISLREGVNLQLQLIKIPGCDKSVSTYKLLWRSLACLSRFVQPHVMFTASQPWEAQDALNFLYTDSFEKLENY